MFPPPVPLKGNEGIPLLLDATSLQCLHQLRQGFQALLLPRAWCQEYEGPAYSYSAGMCLNVDH